MKDCKYFISDLAKKVVSPAIYNEWQKGATRLNDQIHMKGRDTMYTQNAPYY
ncbi:conserved hypothetical protein [delta proteobacterium NaphS2]|nr:conserved hypothetical protein [delta proteobacterium NaphS2]